MFKIAAMSEPPMLARRRASSSAIHFSLHRAFGILAAWCAQPKATVKVQAGPHAARFAEHVVVLVRIAPVERTQFGIRRQTHFGHGCYLALKIRTLRRWRGSLRRLRLAPSWARGPPQAR